jgi:tetratricopeptide (TPR) repeat protein
MKNTTFVALLLLTNQCWADVLPDSMQAVESEWASIYYNAPKQSQASAYEELLKKIQQLKNPGQAQKADLLYWQAVLIATRAELQDGFNALKSINKAKDLLDEAIKINPQTANGSAYVVLGTLYYMVPKWPIAFGDNEKARQMFQQALKINPNGIDANYFYGDYLLSNNQAVQAQHYFEKALEAPIRKHQAMADSRLKNEVKLALQNAKNRKINSGKNSFFSLFNSASAK